MLVLEFDTPLLDLRARAERGAVLDLDAAVPDDGQLFLAHRSELQGKMAACRDNPGDAKHDPECENAYQARLSISAADAQAHADASRVAMQAQREQDMRANPGMMVYKLQYCNNLPTDVDRRMTGCAAVYSYAQELSRTLKAKQ